jgi:hypothetical protein
VGRTGRTAPALAALAAAGGAHLTVGGAPDEKLRRLRSKLL